MNVCLPSSPFEGCRHVFRRPLGAQQLSTVSGGLDAVANFSDAVAGRGWICQGLSQNRPLWLRIFIMDMEGVQGLFELILFVGEALQESVHFEIDGPEGTRGVPCALACASKGFESLHLGSP